MSTVPETIDLPQASVPRDNMDITVQEMTQHVHQHAAEPRDIDFRVQAFNFALSVASNLGRDFTSTDMIKIAVNIEDYLRNGKAA
jgi:hypothetical protein